MDSPFDSTATQSKARKPSTFSQYSIGLIFTVTSGCCCWDPGIDFGRSTKRDSLEAANSDNPKTCEVGLANYASVANKTVVPRTRLIPSVALSPSLRRKNILRTENKPCTVISCRLGPHDPLGGVRIVAEGSQVP